MPPPSESHLVHPEGLPWEGRRLSADPRPLQTQPEASLGRAGERITRLDILPREALTQP